MTTPAEPTEEQWVDDWLHDTDRAYLSRFSGGPLVVRALGDTGPTTADGGSVTLTLTPEFEDPGVTTYTAAATPVSIDGQPAYSISLPSSATSVPGPYLARWDYLVGGVERIGEQPLMVGGTAPAYDSLAWAMKGIVEGVWLRVADQFDSPMGGPHLQVYMQGHFGRNRIAQLLPMTLARVNTTSQPYQTYTLDTFPVDRWGGLLETALWVETIKHLRRSYLEQPDPIGVTVARLDRRSYMNLWGEILRDEEGSLRDMLSGFKMASMNLGGGSLLVSGGIFPRVSSMTAGGLTHAAPRGLHLWR